MENVLEEYETHRQKRRGGRPPKQGVPRHPCGKIKREPELTEKEKRVNQSTAVDARMRHNDLKKPADAMQPEYGYALGRLYLRDLLHPQRAEAALMLEAGNSMGADYDRYYRLTGIPSPNPKAMDMRRVRGMGGDANVEDVTKASNRMMAIEGILGVVDTDGKPVMSLCKRIILRDEDASNWTPSMLGYLRKGLKALVKHYDLR